MLTNSSFLLHLTPNDVASCNAEEHISAKGTISGDGTKIQMPF